MALEKQNNNQTTAPDHYFGFFWIYAKKHRRKNTEDEYYHLVQGYMLGGGEIWNLSSYYYFMAGMKYEYLILYPFLLLPQTEAKFFQVAFHIAFPVCLGIYTNYYRLLVSSI